jgi:hypothetical protein
VHTSWCLQLRAKEHVNEEVEQASSTVKADMNCFIGRSCGMSWCTTMQAISGVVEDSCALCCSHCDQEVGASSRIRQCFNSHTEGPTFPSSRLSW